MNYYRLHIGDYLRDTAHLSLLEHGVYARLLQVYYTRETPIADGEKYRVVGARADSEREAVDSVLDQFFVLTDGAWVQSRCDREIAEYQSKAERNRVAGMLGGRPPKDRNPDVTQTVSKPNPDITLASSHKPRERQREVESIREGVQGEGKRAPAGARLLLADLPDDFRDFCRNERPDLDPERTWHRFRDHWTAQPGQRGRKADWLATWRNWCRSERAPPPRAGPPSADRNAATVAGLTGRANGSKPHSTEVIDVIATATPAIAGRLGR